MKVCWAFLSALILTAPFSLRGDGCCCQSKLPGVTSPDFVEGEFTWIARPYHPDFSTMLIANLGRREVRGNLTLAWRMCPENFWKFTYEYLSQDLRYDFGVGKKSTWRQQSGAGIEYQYNTSLCFLSSVNASSYLSYAPSHELPLGLCHKSLTPVRRRVAGSHAWGAKLGVTIPLFSLCSPFFLRGDFMASGTYDEVEYLTKFSKKRNRQGWGSSLRLRIDLPRCLDIDLLAELRHPFDFYRGSFMQKNFLWRGVGLGAFASYVKGKDRLPSHATYGIQLTYSWQGFGCLSEDCLDVFDLYWAETPAYYSPEVLAISEKTNKGRDSHSSHSSHDRHDSR